MAEDEKQVLEFVPKFEYKKFVADSKKGYRALQREQQATTRLNKKLAEGIGKTGKAYKDWEKEVNKAVYAADLTKVLNQVEDLAELQERLIGLEGEAAKATQKEIDELEKRYDSAIKGADKYTKSLLTIKEAAAKLHKEEEELKFEKIAETAGYGGRKAGEDIAEGFSDALSSLSSKDLAGFAQGFAKQLGSASKYIKGAGMRHAARGAAEEGGGGALAKGIGALMKGVGPLLSTVSKLAPMITLASGAMMAIVKLFLDADSAAKDFNKQVLATSGTANILAKHMGDVDAASTDLTGMLKDMYTSANSLDNLRWGISKETHGEVISALTAEGVQIDKIADYFEDVKKGAAEAQGYVKDWGSMVQLSVAYSRAFGVSLGEITQFQGEMMAEMGMNFAMVQNSFQQILEGARESGIASNKFFAIIRGVSADLSLFNLRMADAVKLLGQVGKVMSPRNAQQFMQTVTHMFKGMGLMERTKSTLLAGGGGKVTKDILQKDLDNRLAGLGKDMALKLGKGMIGKDLKQIIKSPQKLMAFMAEQGDNLDGSTREALLDAAKMQGKLTKGGLVNVASALKDASPMAAMDQLDAISNNMFKKPFEDLTDVQRIAFENITGVGDEQVDQLSKFKSSLDLTKETLAHKLETNGKLTQDEADLLQKLNIQGTSQEKAKALRDKKSREVWDTMSKQEQDTLAKSAETIDWAKETGKNTQSMTEKMQVFMDWLMNQFYDVVLGIWDSVDSMLSFMHSSSKKLEIAVAKGKNTELSKVFKDSKGDAQKFKGDAIMKVLGPQLAKSMSATQSEIDSLAKAKTTETDPDKSKAIDKRMQELVDSQDETRKSIIGGLDATAQLNVISEKGLNLTEEQTKAIKDQIMMAEGNGQQMDLFTALQKAQVTLSKDQLDELTRKSLWGMTPEQLAGLNFSQAGAPAAEAATPAAAKPTPEIVTDPNASPLPGPQLPSPPAPGAVASTLPGPQLPPPPAPPVSTPSAAVAAAAPPSQQGATADDVQKAADSQSDSTQDALDKLQRNVRQQSHGIVLNSSYLKNQYGSQIEDSVYNAVSQALFEQWVTEQAGTDSIMNALKRGVNRRDIVTAANTGAVNANGSAGGTEGATAAVDQTKKGFAKGGIIPEPKSPDSVFVSARPGETILPRGGGGGGEVKVVLELKGDMLKQIIRAQALNTINDHDRAQKTR